MLKVSGNAVGNVPFEVCPDKFIGVKLRRISGKMKGLNSRVAFKELLDKFGPVKRASIPKKEDQAPEMPVKELKELSDLFGPDVLAGMKTGIESKASSLGRNGNGGDSRDFAPVSGDNELRRFSLGCPSFPEIGDKREPALIQEYQAGSKLFGLFLYGAKRAASSNGWLVPGAPWLSSAASDNSIQGCPSDTKGWTGSSLSGSSLRRPCRCVSKSKDLSSNRPPKVLAPRYVSEFSSANPTEEKIGPYESVVLNPMDHSGDKSAASEPRSLKKLLFSRLRPGKCVPASKGARPGVAVFRVFEGCHEVS